MNKFSYNILLASESPDDIIEKGIIDKGNAIKVFSEFPFFEELSKRNKNAELMAPTVTYINELDKKNLAIWMEKENLYTIWYPDSFCPCDNISDKNIIIRSIELFFDRKYEQLIQFIHNNQNRT